MKLRSYDECGYPLFYVHPQGFGAYCADCMNIDINENMVNPDEVTPAVNWEDQELYCSECCNLITPAYD